MTIDPAFNTSAFDDAAAAELAINEDEARYYAEMIEVWTNGRRVAKLAAETCQAFGDELAARLAHSWALMPALPCTDPAEWHEVERPLAPVSMAEIEEHLRLLVRDIYALAGTYRRCEVELTEALRQNSSPVADSDGAR